MLYDLGFPLIAPNGSSTGVSEYSQAVELKGENAVSIMVTAVNLNGATNVGWQLQSSNDLATWVNEGTGSTVTSVAATGSSESSGISARYVRLRYWGTGAAAIVSAKLNTSRL